MNNFGRKLAEQIGLVVLGGTVTVGEIRLDSKMSRQEYRNRLALLNLVKTAWVEGVLEKSLHEQISIVLGLEKCESAVIPPWNLNFIRADQAPEPLPTGTPVIEVFDKLGAGGTLLILGEPGSGKTITLLQLARDLIKRAEDDINYPIPVVLNLSSWAVKTQTISQWIVEELNSNYQVNRKIGQQWVEKQELLLLLDGLDEIRDLEKRKACVIALNTFQQEQSTEMVVCCRVKDYEKLGNKLRLQSALILQPLTPAQIQDYLNRLQSNLAVLKNLLIEDITLQELAQSPLLLNIMVLTYQGIEFADFPIITSNLNRKQQLFNKYIDRIFQDSRLWAYHPNYQSLNKQEYSYQHTIRWLVWISQNMLRDSQTIFSIDNIGTNWLSGWKQHITYNSMVGISCGIILGLAGFTISFTLLPTTAFIVAIIGFSSGILFGFFGELVGLGKRVRFAESLKWSWQNLIDKPIQKLILGVIVGLIGGIGGNIAIYVTYEYIDNWIDLLFDGIWHGLNYGVTIGFVISLLHGSVTTIEDSIKPNQRFLLSLQHSFIFFTIGLVVTIFILQLENISFFEAVYLGIAGGLGLGSVGGGIACIQHLILRIIFYSLGHTPKRYVYFLDWASDKLFLQKVGGGYIFIHRSLMEHFAEMDTHSSAKDV